jgi:hypothetical protein
MRYVAPWFLMIGFASCGPQMGPGSFSADFKTNRAYFSQMSRPVDNSGMDAATFVHKLQRTWYSSNVQGLLGQGDLPVGTVGVKEVYNANNEATNVLWMTKKSKDTWFYELRAKDGAEMMGAPKGDNIAMCHGCHTKFSSTDYLAGTAVKN